MICVDASLVAAWLLPEELSDKAIQLREDLRQAGETFIAPNILTAEVTSTLRKAVYHRRVPLEFGEDALESFKLFPIEVHDQKPLMDTAWNLAKDLNAPRLYDLYYLALAEREGCDLWTADRRFVRLVGKNSTRLHWVGDVEVSQ